MKTAPNRAVVLDANVLISAALLTKSVSAKAFINSVEHFNTVQSSATWDEFREILFLPKFDRYLNIDERHRFLDLVIRTTQFIECKTVVTDCRDPKDNKFLALAIDASAAFIVTGDKDLLVLHPYRGISVSTPADFNEHISTAN